MFVCSLLDYYFRYKCVYFLGFMYTAHMKESTEGRKDIRYPGTEGTENCELLSRYLELISGLLQEQ